MATVAADVIGVGMTQPGQVSKGCGKKSMI